MLKKAVIGIVIIFFLTVIVTIGINKYIESTTTVEYGVLPSDHIPELYKEITYTIPTINEQGEENSQTFTVENRKDAGNIVKLAVHNNKVKNHEFIKEKEIPKQVKVKMPRENF